jgi:zinc transporter
MWDRFALLLDGQGSARPIDREAVRRWRPRDGALWLTLDPRDEEDRRWLAAESGLPEGDRAALLRPVRFTRFEVLDDGGLQAALRMFAADSDAPRGARLHLNEHRLIVVSADPFPALDACAERLARGAGPADVAGLILTVVRVATSQDQVAAFRLDEKVTSVEAAAQHDPSHALGALRDVQQRAASLRRSVGALRETLAQLRSNTPRWLDDADRAQLRDEVAEAGEIGETLDALVDRVRALQEYAQNKLSTALNDRLYLLTIVSAIMMPLSFVTGLLGVNVGGIPARETPWAFPALCALLALLGVGEYALLRRLRWVPNDSNGPRGLRRGPRR